MGIIPPLVRERTKGSGEEVMKKMILPAAAAGIPREAGHDGLEPAHVSPDLIERVMLLVSELATNRVRYGNLPVGASGELSMRVEPDCIRLEMRDVEATPRMDR